MVESSHEPTAIDLVGVAESVLAKARESSARRAAETVYPGRDGRLRATALGLLAGAELGEHESPEDATLHVLVGRVRLAGTSRSWEVGAGQIVPIPPERHSLTALEDTVVLLTVLR